jgi:CheY-like chemotaxis protein
MALILEVDDDMVQRTLIKRTLSIARHQVVTVDNGEKALAHLKANRPLPDLVLTDVMMPTMDGWEMVRQMRANPETALIPVVFFTALDNPADRLKGYNLAADDYVGKTTPMGELSARVDACLRRSHELKEKANSVFRTRIKLAGKLDELGVAGLLTTSAASKATGELILRGPRIAHLTLKDGQVYAAKLAGPPGPVDAECVYLCLTWNTGTFQFAPKAVNAANSVNLTVEMMLLEAAGRAKAAGG